MVIYNYATLFLPLLYRKHLILVHDFSCPNIKTFLLYNEKRASINKITFSCNLKLQIYRKSFLLYSMFRSCRQQVTFTSGTAFSSITFNIVPTMFVYCLQPCYKQTQRCAYFGTYFLCVIALDITDKIQMYEPKNCSFYILIPYMI